MVCFLGLVLCKNKNKKQLKNEHELFVWKNSAGEPDYQTNSYSEWNRHKRTFNTIKSSANLKIPQGFEKTLH